MSSSTASTNPLANLAKADLALVLGVLVSSANNIAANPTGFNALVQVAALPTEIAKVAPAAESLDIGGIAAYIAQLAAEKQAALNAA